MDGQGEMRFYEERIQRLGNNLNSAVIGETSPTGGLTLVLNVPRDITKESQPTTTSEKTELPYRPIPACRTHSLSASKQKPVPPPKPKFLKDRLVSATQEQPTKPKQILEPKPSIEPRPGLAKALSVDCLSVSSGHGSLQSPPKPNPPRPRRKTKTRRKLSVKPEEVSNTSSSNTSSLESGVSYTSAITASSSPDTSAQSHSSTHSGAKTRGQRASRENLNKFIEKHTKLGLTRSLPIQPSRVATTTTATTTTPYTEQWMRKKQYLSVQKRHRIRDVKFDGVGNIIMTTKSSVQLYDNNGVFLEKLYTNRVSEPWGVHVNQENGHVLVSDADEDCVKEFNALGIVVQEYGPVAGPRGVAMTSAGYVFVCSETDSCVYVFDRHAQLITVIGEGVLSAPTYIALHHKTILVSDESRIIGFSVESEIEYVYGQADGSRHPACLCVDNQTGFVLATSYYKDKLIAFNGKMERALKVKQSCRPILCAVSPYGHLLVAENNSSGTLLKMFRMR